MLFLFSTTSHPNVKVMCNTVYVTNSNTCRDDKFQSSGASMSLLNVKNKRPPRLISNVKHHLHPTSDMTDDRK
jgi:hypothetical protein